MTSQDMIRFYLDAGGVISGLELLSLKWREKLETVRNYEKYILESTFDSNFEDVKMNGPILTYKKQTLELIERWFLEFDVLDEHVKVIEVQKNFQETISRYPDGLIEVKDAVEKIIDKNLKVCTIVLEYLKSKKDETLIEGALEIREMQDLYIRFIEQFNIIKNMVISTENKIDKDENIREISLQFYNKNNYLKDYISYFEGMQICYDELCQLLNISTADYQLHVVKIESGSLYKKLKGAVKVIDTFGFLFEKITELIYNKFTFEGQILRKKQILDFLLSNAEVMERYRGSGVELDVNSEAVQKCHLVLIGSIQKMIEKTPKVRIDNKEISIAQGYEQKFIEQAQNKQIEESTSDETNIG